MKSIRADIRLFVSCALVALATASCAESPPPVRLSVSDDAVSIVSYESVGDASVAAAYLAQELPPYLAKTTTGDLQVRIISVSKADEIAAQLWDAPLAATQLADPADVYLAVFHASDGAFVAPRPRAGLPAAIAGDTFVMMMAPAIDLESRGTTSWKDIEGSVGSSLVAFEATVTVEAGINPG